MQACLHVFRYPVSTHVCAYDFCVSVCRIPMFFAFILWYFQVPKLANRKRDYYLFKEIVIGMHTDLPEAQKVLLFLEDWKWEHDPVCLLRRNQCLAILLHPWRDLEITEETGGFNFLAGKGMDVATQGNNSQKSVPCDCI